MNNFIFVETKPKNMKFSFLKQIITEHAVQLKETAAYSGSYSDGGSSNLLYKLKDYQDKIVVKLDLKPSEFFKLNELEIGEPPEFKSIIEEYKVKLSKNIKL